MSPVENDDEIDLLELLAKVQKHARLAVAVCLVVCAGAVVIALLSTPFYQSVTKMVYQSSAKSTGSLSSLASLAGISMGSSDASDASAYMGDLVLSDDLLGQLLDRTWKVSRALPDTSTPVLLETLWKDEADTTMPDWQAWKREMLLQRLTKGSYVTFDQDKKSGVMTITTEFEDPRVAYDVNVFLYKQLNDMLIHKMNFKAKANREFIEGRLTEVKADLVRSEEVLKNFREANRLRQDPDYQLREGRLTRDVSLNQEIMLQLQKQYESAKIEEAKDLPVLDIIDSPRIPVEKSKPKRRMIAMGGLAGGIILGILAALGYDAWLEWRRKKQTVVDQ